MDAFHGANKVSISNACSENPLTFIYNFSEIIFSLIALAVDGRLIVQNNTAISRRLSYHSKIISIALNCLVGRLTGSCSRWHVDRSSAYYRWSKLCAPVIEQELSVENDK